MPVLSIREQIEARERETLSPFASLSSRGGRRAQPYQACPLRTAFQRDRDRIVHSAAFRALRDKTQVFILTNGGYYRTRLTHTMEVSQIARTIARALNLNEDLTEAIALGHDLGHTPFGHVGEQMLSDICPYGFRHYLQSVRVVDYLENEGRGLNLTYEVKNGIACHSYDLNRAAATREGQIVRMADKIAYINHDINDAVLAGILQPEDLPAECIEVLGDTGKKRINAMVLAIVENGPEQIVMSPEIKKAHDNLRAFMFSHVYRHPAVQTEGEKAKLLVERLYYYFKRHNAQIPPLYKSIANRFSMDRAVCDYIAGMTDNYAVYLYQSLFIPKSFPMSF